MDDNTAAQIIEDSQEEFSSENAPVVSEKYEYPAVKIFAYDEDYAKEKGTYHRTSLAAVANIIAGTVGSLGTLALFVGLHVLFDITFAWANC